MTKAWFITGAARGFGREIVLAALRRGDKVAATVRREGELDEVAAEFGDTLLVHRLDVTDRAAVFDAVDKTAETFGRIDVVVNNAGYGLFGAVEEVSIEQARHQLEVNLFGPLSVVQAALPVLRAQGSGHIIQISSIGGVVAYPMLGLYHASKWALEGLTEALSQEVGGFGITTTLIEPGGYATDWGGSSAVNASQLPAYQEIHDARAAAAADTDPAAFGSPAALARGVLEVVDEAQPPARALLGAHITDIALSAYRDRMATWEQGRTRADAAQN